MKLVINRCFGIAELNDAFAQRINADKYDFDRTNAAIINAIETGESVSAKGSNLVIAEIPENSTDYYINDYDGMESVLYVVDGKINWA